MRKLLLICLLLIANLCSAQSLILPSHLTIGPGTLPMARDSWTASRTKTITFGPGFSPMQRGGVIQVPADPLIGLAWATWDSGNWVDSGSGRAERWRDSSGNGNDLIQPSGSIQPLIQGDHLFADTDTTTAKPMHTSGNLALSANEPFTFVMKFAYGPSAPYQGIFYQVIDFSINGFYNNLDTISAKRTNTVNFGLTGWASLAATQTFAIVDDGQGSAIIYQNGSKKLTVSNFGTSAISSPFQLFGANGNPFKGSIYSAAVYKRALSDIELAAALGRLK